MNVSVSLSVRAFSKVCLQISSVPYWALQVMEQNLQLREVLALLLHLHAAKATGYRDPLLQLVRVTTVDPRAGGATEYQVVPVREICPVRSCLTDSCLYNKL